MDTENLRKLACDFRKALEDVSDKNLYGRLSIFRRFPNGCCTYASDLLAQYLIDNGIPAESIQTITSETYKERYTHCWVMIDERIFMDITADQFNGKAYFMKYSPIPDCCIVPRNTGFYKLFHNRTTEYSRNVGLDAYGDDISEKLKTVYSAAIQQIEGKAQRR